MNPNHDDKGRFASGPGGGGGGRSAKQARTHQHQPHASAQKPNTQSPVHPANISKEQIWHDNALLKSMHYHAAQYGANRTMAIGSQFKKTGGFGEGKATGSSAIRNTLVSHSARFGKPATDRMVTTFRQQFTDMAPVVPHSGRTATGHARAAQLYKARTSALRRR